MSPEWATTPEVLDYAATRFGPREALVEGDERWDFAELRARAHGAARALMASGVAVGDRVAIWAPNIREWVVTALGVHCAGAVLVPVNTRFKAREAAHVLRTSKARMLFCVSDFLDTDYVAMITSPQADVGDCLAEIVVMRGSVPDGAVGYDEFTARATAVSDAARAERTAGVAGGDLCNIMFTSGTTGDPKGAMLTHGATCRSYRSWSDVIGLNGDRYLIVNPFFHSFGLNAGILACLMSGSTMVPHLVFDVDSVMRRVAEERITMLPGPPAIYQSILSRDDLDSFDLSTLRLAVTGAAAIPVEMIVAMRERLGFEKVVTGYGLTETTGIATMCRHDDDPEIIARTSGRAIPGVEVRVVGPAGDEMPRGEPGEVVVRGYNVMVGYLDDPERTAETIDGDGWLHTGDIGVMDEAGNLDITDRLKDMFICGGFNAYPAEIENLMARHHGVGQAAVVGVADERLGEVGFAFVVPTAGSERDAAELIAWCRAEMANYKAPRYVEFVDALPLNASGKVLKNDLRRQAAELLSPKQAQG